MSARGRRGGVGHGGEERNAVWDIAIKNAVFLLYILIRYFNATLMLSFNISTKSSIKTQNGSVKIDLGSG
jgi:hypothetical protein